MRLTLLPRLVPALMLAALSSVSTTSAQEFVIGVDDVLNVAVYLHPEMDRTVAVSQQGSITFPPIGLVQAAGLTPKQLGERISDRLVSYLRQTTSVTVSVTQYLSRSIYVTGAVAKPGRYGFEVIPSLVEVIAQAGGAIPGADLSRIEIARREGESRRTLYADVASALRDGVGVPLPELRPGDTVMVPPGLGLAGGEYAAGGAGVGVLGEVAKPGLYSVGAGQDLWTVLAVAGGLTSRGDLGNVRIISRDLSAQTVAKVNLRRVLDHGARGPLTVKPGDVVYVPPSGASQFGRALTGMQTLLAISRDVLQIAVLSVILQDRNLNP